MLKRFRRGQAFQQHRAVCHGYMVEAEAFGRLRFDAHLAGFDSQQPGHAFAEFAGDGDNLRLGHDEHGVDVDDLETRGRDLFQRGLQEDAGGRALPAWIAGREEGADIAGGDRAQQRIGDGVQEDVAVGVAGEALGVRDGQAANHQRHAGLEGV